MPPTQDTLIKRLAALEMRAAIKRVKPPPEDAPPIDHETYRIFIHQDPHNNPITWKEARQLAVKAERLATLAEERVKIIELQN